MLLLQAPLRLSTAMFMIMIDVTSAPRHRRLNDYDYRSMINGMLHALLTLFTTKDDDANKHITLIDYS